MNDQARSAGTEKHLKNSILHQNCHSLSRPLQCHANSDTACVSWGELPFSSFVRSSGPRRCAWPWLYLPPAPHLEHSSAVLRSTSWHTDFKALYNNLTSTLYHRFPLLFYTSLPCSQTVVLKDRIFWKQPLSSLTVFSSFASFLLKSLETWNVKMCQRWSSFYLFFFSRNTIHMLMAPKCVSPAQLVTQNLRLQ